MEDNNRLASEKAYLESVKQAITKELEYQKEEIETIPKIYRNRYSGVTGGDEKLVDHLISIAQSRIEKLENSSGNPYFGRIDFLEADTKKLLKLYIGKTSIFSDNKNQLTIDWRAPACTLYYDQSLGKVSYNAPEGDIFGELMLKSQILIDNGNLIDVRDTDIVSDDELLRPYLEVSKDSRMRNIIASIQKEQNAIIRKPYSSNIIVQGSAGSGKTTVALHRIAYLIYNESKKYKPEQFVVIGPNKYFNNYISTLLPDLDADAVKQYTLIELAEQIIDQKVEIEDQSISLLNYLKNKGTYDVIKYKSSLNYKNDIDEFLYSYFDLLTNKDIELLGETLITSDQIKKYIFNGDASYKESANNYIQNAISYIKSNQENLNDRIWQKYKLEFLSLNKDDPRRKEILQLVDDAKKQLATGCSNLIKSYFKAFNSKPLEIYEHFIDSFERFSNINNCGFIEQLKQNTLKGIKKKKIAYEDISALIYISMKLDGYKEFDKYANVVIDESQDLGMFDFFVLKKLFNRCTFSIFGDLAQSIYSYRSINNWDEVANDIFDSKCELIYLEKSYRTTIEIMTAANNITQALNINTAVPVLRHGSTVTFQDIEPKDKTSYIINKINEFLDKKYQSIAVICKTQEESEKIYCNLKKHFMNIKYINYSDELYEGNIFVLTSYLAKGLEFDTVIISDASENVYSSDLAIDMKLLYIAMTRALHELDIVYINCITKYLENCIIDNSLKQDVKYKK